MVSYLKNILFTNTSNLSHVVSISVITLFILAMISTSLNLGWVSLVLSIILPILVVLNIFVSIYGLLIRKYYYIIGLIIYLINFNSFYSFSNEKGTDGTKGISVLSYNAASFRYRSLQRNDDIPSKIIKFIDSIQPDILALQESHSISIRKLKGYNFMFSGHRKNKEKTLLTIHSKFPILNTGYTDFPNTRNNGIYADILIHKDTIRLYNLHLQSYQLRSNSFKINKGIYDNVFKKMNYTFSQQIKQAQIVRNNLESTRNKILICGDLNTPQNTLPYHILGKELNDSFLKKGHGLGTSYNLKGYPLRLDYIFLDKRIEVVSHTNFDIKLSDHEPVLAKFKF
ncbi:endonuclease/exonuclease/phosphatase [Formosa agariphila KMM 3901]|uniref:Endonuclease/exonuclease/phosphatase n=1 Tax=Formosa agariphila (strain DSM 15362 / KCTC 12365 / LMG 23005 / KMM 3901 / M-2Alg 35-1) TaxID=1347342 RepID=T2KPS6_FORAG|nr:endonuclease/exonuclease/phosphatase family protein [Formosa agariphila]CDF79999.1 endonuclease/exonuclease/phosphatase [Formosa agariphila KMM 3901]